jgi:hypothetical protein
MKKFLVNIWAYDHHARFEVLSEDNPQSLENAILDKLGEKSIKWEHLGITYDNKINRITYEEVINDTKLEKSSLRSSWKKQLSPTGKTLLKVPLHKFQ